MLGSGGLLDSLEITRMSALLKMIQVNILSSVSKQLASINTLTCSL